MRDYSPSRVGSTTTRSMASKSKATSSSVAANKDARHKHWPSTKKASKVPKSSRAPKSPPPPLQLEGLPSLSLQGSPLGAARDWPLDNIQVQGLSAEEVDLGPGSTPSASGLSIAHASHTRHSTPEARHSPPEATFTPTAVGLREVDNQILSLPWEFRDFISAAISQGVDSELSRRSRGLRAPSRPTRPCKEPLFPFALYPQQGLVLG